MGEFSYNALSSASFECSRCPGCQWLVFDEKDFGIVHFYNHNFRTTDKTNIALNFFQEINIRDTNKSFYESKTSLNNFGVGIQIGTPIITLYLLAIVFLILNKFGFSAHTKSKRMNYEKTITCITLCCCCSTHCV